MEISKFFTSLSHYIRYTKVISYPIKEHEYELDSYGNVENLASHSVWKRGGTFVWSESIVGPSIVSILLRAWWEITVAKGM